MDQEHEDGRFTPAAEEIVDLIACSTKTFDYVDDQRIGDDEKGLRVFREFMVPKIAKIIKSHTCSVNHGEFLYDLKTALDWINDGDNQEGRDLIVGPMYAKYFTEEH